MKLKNFMKIMKEKATGSFYGMGYKFEAEE